MKTMLLATSLIVATMAMAGEIAPTQEITLPNGEKRVIYLNGTDRYTPVDDTIDDDYIKEKAEDNTWHIQKKEEEKLTNDRKKQIEKDKKDAKEYDKENRKKKN